MQVKYVFFAVFFATLEIAFAHNYCDSSLCGTKTHIACNNAGNFASSCINPSLIALTQANINLIVDAHNTQRNNVASGNTKLGAACRMATMQWSNQLAYLASLNVKQCRMKHDACRNTAAFKHSGQNLAWITFNGAADMTALLQRSVAMWYKEIANTNMAHINKYPSGYSGPAIGHFTAMMRGKNNRIGCAVATYGVSGKKYKAFLIACNYGTTNLVNSPVYTVCSTAASGCTTGTNPNFKSLCSISEVFNLSK